MTAPQATQRRALSPSDKVIVATHALVAISFGVIGWLTSTDDGWADLQRAVIAMLTVVWLGLVAASAVIVRFVHQAWARVAILLGLPVVTLAAVVFALR